MTTPANDHSRAILGQFGHPFANTIPLLDQDEAFLFILSLQQNDTVDPAAFQCPCERLFAEPRYFVASAIFALFLILPALLAPSPFYLPQYDPSFSLLWIAQMCAMSF